VRRAIAIILCSMAASLSACAGSPALHGHCWNDAIYAYGTALANGYEARMYIQETPRSKEGIYHAQAVAFIDGEARWLNVYD
jgi:hypothetical protein